MNGAGVFAMDNHDSRLRSHLGEAFLPVVAIDPQSTVDAAGDEIEISITVDVPPTRWRDPVLRKYSI